MSNMDSLIDLQLNQLTPGKQEDVKVKTEIIDDVTKLEMLELQMQIDQLKAQVLQQTHQVPLVLPQSTSLRLQPQDISLLQLAELSSIEGIANKISFFGQIRRITNTNAEAVHVCLSRVDKHLRLFIENKINTIPNITLQEIEDILDKEFSIPKSLPDCIDRLISEEVYTIDVNPREFAHKFKVRYTIIHTAFQKSGLPNMAKILKEAMSKGLDPFIKQQLGSVLMTEFGEEDFLKRLEAIRLGRLVYPTHCHQVQTNANLSSSNVPQCRYCKGNVKHYLSDCPLKPARGSCYDCLSVRHRAGSPYCPKSSHK